MFFRIHTHIVFSTRDWIFAFFPQISYNELPSIYGKQNFWKQNSKQGNSKCKGTGAVCSWNKPDLGSVSQHLKKNYYKFHQKNGKYNREAEKRGKEWHGGGEDKKAMVSKETKRREEKEGGQLIGTGGT